MNNKEYWEKRSLLIENESFKDAEYHLQKIKEQYETAKQNLEKEIAKFYEDFAINNQIQLADAKKVLDNNELKEFKTTLKQYRKMVEEGNETLQKKINNISIKHRITRLQALKDKIDIMLEQLSNNINKEVNNALAETVENTYYKTIHAFDKESGIHTDFSMLNPKTIDAILTYNWSGATYSDRVWRNQKALKEKLSDALNKNFIQGNSISELSTDMSKVLETSYKNCTRLLRTEVNYMNNRTSIEVYKEKGIKKYQIVAVLDLRTSEVCRDLDGKIYDIEEMVVGVNCPPFHPNCRTTIIPYIEGVIRNRVARNIETGKTEEVGNLTYKEWYKKYVINNKNDVIIRKNINKEEKTLKYKDITDEMYKNAKPKHGKVEKQNFYEDKGKKYFVDGHNVVYKHDGRELEVARLLNSNFGGNVKILPNINFPQGIKSPDYLYKGERTDLKRITSKRANDCVKTALKNKEKQANNFIIDNTVQNVKDEDVIKQIEEIYSSRGFKWVDKIYLLKDNKFIKVYKRI